MFNIKIPDGAKQILNLTTNTGAAVPISDFVGIIKTFHKSNFVLNVKYVCTEMNRAEKMVTPKVLYSSIDRILFCSFNHFTFCLFV